MEAQVDNNMTNKEAIERWATYIIPAVFKAEDKLLKEHPKWKDRLRCLANGEEDPYKVSEEYCTAIATIIVTTADDFNPNEK